MSKITVEFSRRKTANLKTKVQRDSFGNICQKIIESKMVLKMKSGGLKTLSTIDLKKL